MAGRGVSRRSFIKGVLFVGASCAAGASLAGTAGATDPPHKHCLSTREVFKGWTCAGTTRYDIYEIQCSVCGNECDTRLVFYGPYHACDDPDETTNSASIWSESASDMAAGHTNWGREWVKNGPGWVTEIILP